MIVPLGGDTGAILDQVPNATAAAVQVADEKRWTTETSTERLVRNDAGVLHSQTATGKYLRIYFVAHNAQAASNLLSPGSCALAVATACGPTCAPPDRSVRSE